MSHNKWITLLLIAALAITAMSIAAFAETTADSQPEVTAEGNTDNQTEATAEDNASRYPHGGRSNNARNGKASEPTDAVGKQAAKDAALNDAGIGADEAVKVKTRISRLEDGNVVYKVCFTSGDLWYSYTIDAATGEILDKTAQNAAEHAAEKAGKPGQSTKESGTSDDKPETGDRSRHHGGNKHDSDPAKKHDSDKKSGKKSSKGSRSSDPAAGTDSAV